MNLLATNLTYHIDSQPHNIIAKAKAVMDENAELKRQINYYKGINWKGTRPVVQGLFEYCDNKE